MGVPSSNLGGVTFYTRQWPNGLGNGLQNRELLCSMRVRILPGVQQASLAQLVEHLFCKQDVVGSNPTGGSNILT